MTKAMKLRLAVITAIVMATTLGTFNSSVVTRRARAFTVLTVTNTNDSGPGSLRDTVGAANDGDTIAFNISPLPATITLTSGEIFISKSLTITGPGANQLTVSGNNSTQVLGVSGANVAISGLTIAQGVSDGAGGIENAGTLSVTNCAFEGNRSTISAGAIENSGMLSVTGSLFSNNKNTLTAGGAIDTKGPLCTIVNSTFSGNSSMTGGAGALGIFGGTSNVVNCTISGNSAAPGLGGGIAITKGTLNLVNTIIAGSTGGDCSNQGGMIATNGHNLIQDGSCNPMLSGDPKLGPLQDNGGFTATMALLAGSPAIDAGDDSVLGPPLSLTTDQRGPGFPRLIGTHVDIGAFEYQPGPSFDTCLKDNSSSNLIQWNSSTGQYQFTRCSDNFTLSGTGSVALVNGVRMLTDRKPGRRISAGFITAQLTGSATIYLNIGQGTWQVFRIHDTNPSAVCKC
jgi:hypothetical protein